MAGYGLYYALRGKNNWAQRRQDAQMNLQMQKEMAAMEEQNLQQSLLAEQEIQAAFDKVRELDYLEADKEMIYNKEKQLRSNVIKQIGAYNGDLKRYMSAGGASDLKNYQRSLEDSKEVKLAKANKVEVMRFIEDSKKGDRFFNKTKLRIPKLDENNNPTGEFEESMVDMNDQLALHKQGLINTLNYAGSEKSIPVNMFSFSEHFKDAKNPTGDNRVTQSDIYNYATQMGASHEQAMYHVQQYGDMVKQGGDVWKWKSEDPLMYGLDAKLKQSQINKIRGGSGDGRAQGDKLATVLFENRRLGNGERKDAAPEETEWYFKTAGYKLDKDGNYTSNRMNSEAYIQYTDESGTTQNEKINTFGPGKYLNPTGVITRDPLTGELAMQASMVVDMEQIDDDSNLFVENQLFTEDIVDKFEKDNLYGNKGTLVQDLGPDIYSATVYIPIERYTNNESLMQSLIKGMDVSYAVGKGGPTAELNIGDYIQEEVGAGNQALK